MNIEIKVPEMGESVIEATVVNWLKQEGESVAVGEAVVELETDKVTLEVNAPQGGVLQKIHHPGGDTVSVGDILATLAPQGQLAESEPVQQAEQPAQPANTQQAAPQPVAEAVREGGPPQPTAARADVEPRATPLAQRMAQDLGVDLAKVVPSGSGGRVTQQDVRAFAAQAEAISPREEPPPQAPSAASPPGQTSTPPPGRREDRTRMSRRRQTIARRLVEAQHTAAMLTTFNEIDMGAVIELRKRRRAIFKERFGVDLGYMSFFVKASIAALKAFPNLNAEIQGDEMVHKHYYDIGVAIGAEQGLVVPVVRDADRMNFAEIEKKIREFVEKVNQGTLSLDDLRGGTFTITNGGVFGSMLSTPILNPPQVGILGMHAIKERVMVLDGQMAVRPMMYVALSYDHRMVDGREAVQFLVRIKEMIEEPAALLLE